MNWKAIRFDTQEKRRLYMCSREWGLLRRKVSKRCNGMCERCHNAKMDSVHHLQYTRLYRERLTDLQALCFLCHEFVHGRGDIDPAYDNASAYDYPCDRCGAVADLTGRTGGRFFCEKCCNEMQAISLRVGGVA